jgi:hypothetical protein
MSNHDVIPDDAILIVRVGWCKHEDDGGMDYQVIIGDGNPITKPLEPWMLEATQVALNALQLTKSRIEQLVLAEFVERGRRERETRKRLATEIATAPPVDKATGN